MSTTGMPLSVLVDHSVFYAVEQALKSAGYVDMDGKLTIGVYPNPIENFIPVETDERQYGGEVLSELSVALPAITVINEDERISPGGLGGDNWERRFYEVSVFGSREGEDREMAALLSEPLRRGVWVYDFNLGFPGNSGFPQPNQIIGTFTVENLRDQRVLLPSYSPVDQHRRRLTFDVINLRKS